MSKYFSEGEIVTIEFKDGEWVDIKESQTLKDSEAVAKEIASNPSFPVTTGLKQRIVSWSFAENGISIPITIEAISKLKDKYTMPLIAKINELNKESQDFSKK